MRCSPRSEGDQQRELTGPAGDAIGYGLAELGAVRGPVGKDDTRAGLKGGGIPGSPRD